MHFPAKAAVAFAAVLAVAGCNTHIPKKFPGHATGRLAEDSGYRMAPPKACPQIASNYRSDLGVGGGRRSKPHNGIDYTAKRGTPILAAAPGKVVAVGRTHQGGRAITIYHGEDDQGHHVFSASIHLQEQHVEDGQWVKRGDPIGTMGDSGAHSMQIVHLHFQAFVLNNPQLLEVSQSSFFVKEGRAVAIDYYSTVNPHDLMIRSKRHDEPTMALAEEVPSGAGGAGIGFAGFTYPIACG